MSFLHANGDEAAQRGHVFHDKCISQWFAFKPFECPVCLQQCIHKITRSNKIEPLPWKDLFLNAVYNHSRDSEDAANLGRVRVFQNVVNDETLIQGLSGAVLRDDSAIVQAFLQNSRITQREFCNAFNNAATGGSMRVLRTLLQNNRFPITSELSRSAIQAARQSGHPEVVELLAPSRNRRISLITFAIGLVILSMMTNFFWNRSAIL